MEERVQGLVKLWSAKAKRERDPFSRFVYLYFCFNAIIANLSGEEYDSQMISWACGNNNLLKRRFSQLHKLEGNNYFPQRLEALKNLTPIQSNLRNKPDRTITDIHNFEEVIRAIYYVRCNLFHGCKSPNSVRDQKLVKVSADILQKLISPPYN